MLDFNKLLFEGTLTEMSVIKMVNQEPDLMRDLLLSSRNTWDWTCKEAEPTDPFDLRLQIGNTEAYYSVEVKSARNGGKYPTFFAETLQVGSNTYPEYLGAVPTFICYVDTINGDHYWYCGETFVEQVKANIDNAFPIAIGTAEGLKFPKEDKSWGYLCSYQPDFTLADVALEYKPQIKKRLENKDKQGSTLKAVDGLKTLS